jgi:uncharacterized protein (TIGR02246 family)
MYPLRRLLSLLACAAALASSLPAADRAATEAEVARVDAARIAALLAGDLKALERIFADDLVYVHSAGKIDGKKDYLASLASGTLTYVSLRYDPPARIVPAGPGAAIVTGRATIEVKNKAGQLTKRVLTTTTVYVRGTQGWQVAAYQATPVQ